MVLTVEGSGGAPSYVASASQDCAGKSAYAYAAHLGDCCVLI